MTVTRLTGGLTPGDGADPRTFPAIFNDAADVIDATQGSAVALGSAVADLEDLNPVQFGTAVPTDGQVLVFSTAVSAYVPEDPSFPDNAYAFVQTLQFTSDGTFSKADYPWLRAIRVKCQGAGGGSGGCATTGAGAGANSAGGGGGGYAESFITNIAGLDASITVTRGAGGAAGASGDNAGSAGGSSSFGTVVSAAGGGGGLGSGAFARAVFNGADGGTSNTGDFTISGAGAGFSEGSSTVVRNGQSGAGFLAAAIPTRITFSSQAAVAGNLYGGGARGGAHVQNTAARAGAAGGNGIVVVELYA